MRTFFTKDLGWKLFSVFLAAFIWYTVHRIIEKPSAEGTTTDQHTITYAGFTYAGLPVLIVATAADMHLYRVQPDKISVTVSGPEAILADLSESQIRPTVDLSHYDPADTRPQRVEVAIPGGVTLVKVTPETVRVIVPNQP